MDKLLPEHLALLHLYQARATHDAPPRFYSFSLADLIPHLGHIAVLAREPGEDQFTICAAGADVISMVGIELVGKSPAAVSHPSQTSTIRRLQAEMEQELKPRVVRGQLRHRTAIPDVLERLILPCVDGQGAFTHALVSMRPFPT